MSSFDPTHLFTLLQTWWTNISINLSTSVSNLSIRDYIRIIWIVGGYVFLRPYLDKGFRKLFETGQNKADAAQAKAEWEEMQKDGGAVNMSANELRGETAEFQGNSDPDADVGHATGVPQWGKSAKRKQRKFMEYLEQKAEEMKDEDDKDIADLLED